MDKSLNLYSLNQVLVKSVLMYRANIKLVIFSVLLATLSMQIHADSHPPFRGQDLTGRPCAGFSGGYGPYDYTQRNVYSKQLKLVESHHFTSDVESLKKGSTTMLPYGDLEYTLRAWPNHHRALNAMSRYQMRLNSKKKTIKIPAECWFQRAVIYSPNDATAYMLYGMHLHNAGQLQQAEGKYQTAIKLDPNNIEANYNYGLLLVKLKQYEKAKNHAKVAYGRSYPLPGLKNKLAEAGYWP